jgi:hypothetical protein
MELRGKRRRGTNSQVNASVAKISAWKYRHALYTAQAIMIRITGVGKEERNYFT